MFLEERPEYREAQQGEAPGRGERKDEAHRGTNKRAGTLEELEKEASVGAEGAQERDKGDVGGEQTQLPKNRLDRAHKL